METEIMSAEIGTIANSYIHRFEGDLAFFWKSGYFVNADGGRHAYHSEKGKGLDYLANAGSPGNWWGIACDSGGNPYISPEGYYVSTTSLCDVRQSPDDPGRYVDSESIPFIVLPSGNTFGASLGDYAYVYNSSNGRGCGAIYADNGPANKIGEGSIALAKLLKIPHSPKNGGCIEGMIWVVFPGTKDEKIFPIDPNKIQSKAEELFGKWGGLERLLDTYPELESGVALTSSGVSEKNIHKDAKEPKIIMNPVGKIIIDNADGTWIKLSTAAAVTLLSSSKQFMPKGACIPFYSAPVLREGHYVVSIQWGGILREVYVYNGHAHVDSITAKFTSEFAADQYQKLCKYAKSGVVNLDTKTTYYSQRDNYTMSSRTCNSSSSAMLLDWWRRATGQEPLGGDDDYLRKLLAIGDTIYHENQTAAIAQYGFKSKWIAPEDEPTEEDFDRIDELLDNGFPTTVNISHRGTEKAPTGGHIIMLIARRKSEGTYISHDPYGTLDSDYANPNGRYSPISRSSFRNRWQGGHRVLA
jgi:Fungal chitosanase of glycosyl hydrolase group 75/Peptidase_C39 like family